MIWAALFGLAFLAVAAGIVASGMPGARREFGEDSISEQEVDR
jgi:hypothetical protein